MSEKRIVVIGAGIGGLAAALRLAARGLDVTLVERSVYPGGKIRQVMVGAAAMDAGPTVVTMRPVFEELFAYAGTSLDAHVTLRRAEILARHAWSEDERLDLYADVECSADAIGRFAGVKQALLFRAFCARASDMYRTLEQAFIHRANPTPLSLVLDSGLFNVARLRPYSTLWRDLGRYFPDQRLRQLFGRYATYVGSSPFQAPPTLGIVAHVELAGVWMIDGGTYRLPQALAALAAARGVRFRYGIDVCAIDVARGRARSVQLSNGECLEADGIVCNADVATLAAGLFGPNVKRAACATPVASRSLSAVTWNLYTRTTGLPLVRHNVFFCRNYAAEFDAIFKRGRLPDEATVYICAQDRDDLGNLSVDGRERLLCLVNAPPRGDQKPFDSVEITTCEENTVKLLARCGLNLAWQPESAVVTTPMQFNRMFPATGGSLYGRASHGWRGPFSRSGARSRVPGLYLVGGSVHPGPGMPMAAISGRLAAEAVLQDLTSV